jgi:hypothetical protein
MDDHHLPFQLEKALCQHFAQINAAYVAEGWEAKLRRLVHHGANELKIRKNQV